MTGLRDCSAIHCSNNRKNNPDLSFFRFPKDPERCKKWINNLRRDDLFDKSIDYLYKNLRICSIHFEASNFINENRNKLVFSAVPTLFSIPDKPSELSSQRLRMRKPIHPAKRPKICIDSDSSNSSEPSPKIEEEVTPAPVTTAEVMKLNRLINTLKEEVEFKSAEIYRLRKRCEELERVIVHISTQEHLEDRVCVISDHFMS